MENNKKRILDEIKKLYEIENLSTDELELIEKVSESNEFTNEAIELMQTQRSKYNDIVPTKENEKDDILMIFSDVKNRMGNSKESNSLTKTDYNMDRILEVTNRYFKGNKDANLTNSQMILLRNIAEYDDTTNNLVMWLNDAIENDEERTMENYIAEATNAYEMKLSDKEAQKVVQDLKKLNPDVNIKLGKNCTSIDISKPVKELNLPDNFYLDENNRITNKENTALSVFVSLKVNETKENNKNVKEKEKMKKEEKLNEEEIVNDDDFLEEKPRIKKERRKPKFRIFKAIKKGLNFIKNKLIIPEELVKEEINLDIPNKNSKKKDNVKKEEKKNNDNKKEKIDLDEVMEELDIDIPNKDSKEQDKNSENKKAEESEIKEKNTTKNQENKENDNIKKTEDIVNKTETPKENKEQVKTKVEESSESNIEKENTTLSAGENLKRIAKIRSEIERLQKNKEELKNIKDASTFAKEETAKHYDEETKKLRDQIKEIIDNNKYTNEAGREISMEERDRFDRLDTVQADIIETIKKQKQINSEFNEAWYGHMGEKPTEDLLKRRSTLKNELDAINIKLNLLKQKREEIVAENPMIHARTM